MSTSCRGSAHLDRCAVAHSARGGRRALSPHAGAKPPPDRRDREHVARPVHVRHACADHFGQPPLPRHVPARSQRSCKPGMTLSELIRAAQGHRTFSAATWTPTSPRSWRASGPAAAPDTSCRPSDGRIVLAKNEAMPGGGWVSTHEDVTEQRKRRGRARRHSRAGAAARARSTPRSPHSVRQSRACCPA